MSAKQTNDMSRREFIKSSSAAAAGLALGAQAVPAFHARAAGGNGERPNVLYIITDQQFSEAMSCAGNPDVRTPAMDSLAANGVRFTRAYCTEPICSPARAGMFTGRPPHQSGVVENFGAVNEALIPCSLGNLLSGAGYECAYAGKWHLGRDWEVGAGFGFEKVGPGSGNADPRVTESCVEFLRKPHEKPFFLVASYQNPHDICGWTPRSMASGKFASKHGVFDDAPPEKWPQLPPNFGVPMHEPSAIRDYLYDRGGIRSAGFDANAWRHYRYAYYRMVETVDSLIGGLLDELRVQGLDENTVVIFASDHGDGLGAHGWGVTPSKWILYEECIRVPFIVSWKGRTRPGAVDDRLVSVGLDLLPTLCDYAGASAPEGLLGQSLRPVVEGAGSAPRRDSLVVEAFLHLPDPQGRTVHTGRYKYTAYSRGRLREMFVDLQEDPGEMFNRIGDASLARVIKDHRAMLEEWCIDTDDEFSFMWDMSKEQKSLI